MKLVYVSSPIPLLPSYNRSNRYSPLHLVLKHPQFSSHTKQQVNLLSQRRASACFRLKGRPFDMQGDCESALNKQLWTAEEE
jgi:hypothetical protein